MSRPLDALTRVALEDTKPIVEQLRAAGWPIDVTVNQRETGHRVVAIEIHLRVLVPIECVTSSEADARPTTANKQES